MLTKSFIFLGYIQCGGSLCLEVSVGCLWFHIGFLRQNKHDVPLEIQRGCVNTDEAGEGK